MKDIVEKRFDRLAKNRTSNFIDLKIADLPFEQQAPIVKAAIRKDPSILSDPDLITWVKANRDAIMDYNLRELEHETGLQRPAEEETGARGSGT